MARRIATPPPGPPGRSDEIGVGGRETGSGCAEEPRARTVAQGGMTRSRAFALVLALSLGRPAAGASPPVAHPWDTAVADVGRVEQGVVDATNDYRHGEGRSALSAEEVLDRAAQRFADWMARNDKYGHEADGRTASQRLREQGVPLLQDRGEHRLRLRFARVRDRDPDEAVLRGLEELRAPPPQPPRPRRHRHRRGRGPQPQDRLLLRRPALRPPRLPLGKSGSG